MSRIGEAFRVLWVPRWSQVVHLLIPTTHSTRIAPSLLAASYRIPGLLARSFRVRGTETILTPVQGIASMGEAVPFLRLVHMDKTAWAKWSARDGSSIDDCVKWMLTRFRTTSTMHGDYPMFWVPVGFLNGRYHCP